MRATHFYTEEKKQPRIITNFYLSEVGLVTQRQQAAVRSQV